MKKITNLKEKMLCYSVQFLSGGLSGWVWTAIWHFGSTFTVENWIYAGVVFAASLGLLSIAIRGLKRISIMEQMVDENNRRVTD